jgi:predicted nucleic acid-binding Zn ribbon protein
VKPVSEAGAEGRRAAEKAALERVLAGQRRLKKTRPEAAAWSAERDPKLVGDLFEELVVQEGWSLDVSLGSLAAGWEGIVGSHVAEHCSPEAFEAGELTIRADSAAWATQIRLLAGPMLQAVAKAVGDGVVKDIKVVGPAATGRKGRYIVRR